MASKFKHVGGGKFVEIDGKGNVVSDKLQKVKSGFEDSGKEVEKPKEIFATQEPEKPAKVIAVKEQLRPEITPVIETKPESKSVELIIEDIKSGVENQESDEDDTIKFTDEGEDEINVETGFPFKRKLKKK